MQETDLNEMIQILLTPVCELSDSQFDLFRKNREFFADVEKTPEYHKALCEDLRKKKETAGGSWTPYLDDHITHKSGRRKTVCTSAALAFFNIHPSSYHYSGMEDQDNAILRRHRWSVRSRKSKFKLNKGKPVTLGQLRKQIATGERENGHYKVCIKTKEGYHCIVLSNDGQIVVDTAESETNNRCKVRSIYFVGRK